MGRPEPLWTALNCNSLMIGVGCVLAGISAALVHGNAELLQAIACVIFMIFAQLAGNCYYKYCVEKAQNTTNRPAYNNHDLAYSGVDKVAFYKVFAIAMALLALMVGLSLVTIGGWWLLLIGAFVLVAGWLMVGGAMPIVHTPWVPLFTFLLFGPLTVITTSLIQSVHEAADPLSWFDISPALYKSVVMGILAANVNIIYDYVNYDYSVKCDDATFAVVFGLKTTRRVVLISSIVCFVLASFSYLDNFIERSWISIVIGAICFLVNLYIWWRMDHTPKHVWVKVETIANFNVLLMGILSLIAAYLVGTPDDSHLTVF